MPVPTELIISFLALFAVVYPLVLLFIYLARGVLWWFAGAFFLVDELMWVLYNPLRFMMRGGKKFREGLGGKASRGLFLLFTVFLIGPLYKLAIYVLTLPLRLITAIYFDVIMYLFVMTADTIEELFNPKLGAMRFKKGFKYLFWWIVGFPKRLIWFVVKNVLAIVDSAMMLIVSLGWPTFTMFHGTSQDAVVNIKTGKKWLVGGGNYAGSGIYFGRQVKTAKLYAGGSKSVEGKEGELLHPIIVARVTLSALRNVSTLPREDRERVADASGDGGRQIAKNVSFPYFATEFWRTDHGWWEYCLVRGGEDGKLVSSWRIRPVGFAHVKPENTYSGSLQRLWGGKSHYCLSFTNIIMTAISLGLVVAQHFIHAEILGNGGFTTLFGFFPS